VKTRPIQTFRSALERSHNRLWGAHLRVPDSIAEKLVGNRARRVICSFNGSPHHQCALRPIGGGQFVLAVNQKLREALDLKIGTWVDVALGQDNSRYALPMPEEFEELLRQDTEGNRLFHALTKGRQRTLLHLIGLVKGPDLRASRAVIVIRHLRSNSGTIHYKQLYRDLRRR
jgi:hypothetical protein